MKAKSKSYYKKKLKKLFSLYVRKRAGEMCEASAVSTCGGHLHCSHIKTTGAYPNLAYDPSNALCLCAKHHIYWWHKETTEAVEWFKHKYPMRWEYIEVNKNNAFHPTIDDLKELCTFYEEGIRRL